MKIWGLALIIGLFLAMPLVALAQEDDKPTFEVSPRFPSVVGKADSVFRFKVDMNYDGKKPLILSLSAQAPQGWTVRILGGIPEIDVRDMRLEPFKTYSDQIDVELTPPRGNVVEPGEYIAVLEAKEVSPGTLQSKAELKAVVTARYSLNFFTETGRLNTDVTAGKEEVFPLVLRNTSTVALEKLTFSSSKPEGWSITFRPEEVNSIPIGGVQTVEVVIKPPKRTIAGDYAVTLFSQSENTNENIELRVTVKAPTLWVWVGVLLALGVVAGLGWVFRRFGRR